MPRTGTTSPPTAGIDVRSRPTAAALRRADATLVQARALVQDAADQRRPGDRFRLAHLAALRATAALLSVLPEAGRAARRPTSAWILLSRRAPHLGGWASFFSAGAAQRAAADAGSDRAVTAQQAEELLAAVVTYLYMVRAHLADARYTGQAAWPVFAAGPDRLTREVDSSSFPQAATG